MTDSRIDAHVLVNTVIAAGLAFVFFPVSFGWLTTAGGLTLLLILLTYDQQRQRSVLQSLAFSSVCGLCFTLAGGIVLQRLTDRPNLATWLPVTWACATVLGTIIDRYRTSAAAPRLHLGPTAHAPLSGSPAEPRVSNFRIPEAAPEVPAEPPAFTSAPEAPAPFETAEEMPAADSAPQPQPASGYRPPEATIYVDVIGGGISFLRSVRAEHVARDIYRIVDVMPEDEQWRYQPGQTVRCKKRKLSSGKVLVAYQEIVLQRVS